MTRVGLLGGAFNPPHHGHLKLARVAAQELHLDELRFVPTALSPHKPNEGPGGGTRLRLLELALEGLPYLIDTLELDRGGASYTVDTLEALHAREPGRCWILVMGADQAATLATWKRSDRIWELASVAAAGRPGLDLPLPESLEARRRPFWSGAPGELVRLPGTDLDLSSSGLRTALVDEIPVPGLPPQVLAAINTENLYRKRASETE